MKAPQTETPAPIFILGHWRSGTTLLHELLAMHPSLSAPTMVDVLAPTNRAIQRAILAGLLRLFLPKGRPVDGAPWGPHRPAEDDFALAALGMSPYLAWTFPRHAEFFERFLDFDGLSIDEIESWRLTMSRLVALWTRRRGRPLVLKSPPHTARLGELARMFPEAKFVFVHRDPFATFSSAIRLSRDGTKALRLQELSDDEARAGVLRRAERLFAAYRRERSKLAPGRLVEIAYGDLTFDPIGAANRALAHCGMTTEVATMARWREFLANESLVPAPQLELSVSDRADVRSAFGFLFDEFGYSRSSTEC